MIHKYLPIFLLLTTYNSQAKGYTTGSDTTEQSINTILTTESNSGFTIAAIPPGYSGNSGGGGAHFFYGIELGYASATTKAGGMSATGGGFMFNGEMGAKIVLHSQNTNKANFLSISLCGTVFTISDKYKGPQGNSETDKRTFSVLGLPISFTSMSYGRGGEGAGFYWQAGINPNYMFQVKDGDAKVTSSYNSIYFEPFVSAGLSVHFELVNRRTKQNMGGGKALFGPFFAYAATNMAKDNGATMNGYTAGLKWAYVGL